MFAAATILFGVLLRLSFSTVAVALRHSLLEPSVTIDDAPWIGSVARLAGLVKIGASDHQSLHVYLLQGLSFDPEAGLCSC